MKNMIVAIMPTIVNNVLVRLLNIFLMLIFQPKCSLFQIKLTLSSKIRLPDFGVSDLIAWAGSISSTRFAELYPASKQKTVLRSTPIINRSQYIFIFITGMLNI